MRRGTKTIALGLGLLVGLAALRASFADDDADAAFDTPEVKEIAARAGALKLDDQIALLKRIRSSLDRTLLTPSEDSWKGHENLRGRTDAGLARILQRGLGDDLVTPRGGGAYWSFTKRSNSYNEWPQIELQQWAFSSGFYGSNFGRVVKLADADLGAVVETSVPDDLRLDAVEMYEKTHPVSTGAPGTSTGGAAGGGAAGGAGGAAGGAGRRVATRVERPKAEVGAVYAVRAVMWDECDVLAAFQVVSMDTYGATIAWRLLKTYDVPVRKR